MKGETGLPLKEEGKSNHKPGKAGSEGAGKEALGMRGKG